MVMSKDPHTDEERQAYIDNLPDDQKDDNAEQVFDKAIKRAAQPKQSSQEKSPGSSDGYIDTQTHSDRAEDTSHWRSDTFRLLIASAETKSPR